MSETYQSKRERWQRLLETLPAGLREHVSLRNVETVAALPPIAQKRHADAIAAGLKRLPAIYFSICSSRSSFTKTSFARAVVINLRYTPRSLSLRQETHLRFPLSFVSRSLKRYT